MTAATELKVRAQHANVSRIGVELARSVPKQFLQPIMQRTGRRTTIRDASG